MVEKLEQAQVQPRPESPRRVRACPECGGSRLMRDYDAAEVVCMTCGYVVAEKIADSRPEWRAFDDEQRAKRARVGAPMTFTIHDKGLSTIIDWRDRPSGSKSVTADQRIELYKLRKWQRRVRVSDATERNLAVALSELSKLSAALSLPKNILETASVVYRRAIKRSLASGARVQIRTAAAIPFSFGKPISSRIRSGCSSCACRTASIPSSASPTTLKPALGSSAIRTNLRNGSKSSTRSMREAVTF